MRMSAVAFLMILTTVFLSGCGKSDMATLDDHSGNFYGHSGVTTIANAASSSATVQAAPTMAISSNDLSAPTANSNNQAVAANNAMGNHGQNPTLQNTKAPFMTAAHWQWPVHGTVKEKFGQQSSGVVNEGIVIATAQGTPIHAAQAGEVAYVGNDMKNYGNIVILRHADGTMTSYAHASEIVVKKGDTVAAGKVIAYVGKSGNAKEPELHFAVREGTRSVDPLMKLPQQMASN